MSYQDLLNVAQSVTDEKSFVRFLDALIKDCEDHERDCPRPNWRHCAFQQHWESGSTAQYLRSIREWTGGDFIEGRHGGDPILRRVATMMLVGRHICVDERDYG